MKFIFKDAKTETEVALPVAPPSFEASHGIKVETVNIHALGDVVIGGYGTLGAMKISCMFPAQKYPFSDGASTKPYEYVDRFNAWCDSRAVLRFVVTGTPVNIPVLLSDIQYGEKDGTGDVYATISMREYRYVAVPQTQKQDRTGNGSRPSDAQPPVTMGTYIVVPGDTLWAVCRKFYGEPALCYDLARYNQIKNANLIFPGQQLGIPDKSLLKGA